MPADYPIVVYGASGYTGKLICSSLAKRELPFIAAGRNRKRLEEAIAPLNGADARVQEVAHTVEALTGLLKGASVLINVAGPFGQLGETAVRAALNAKCHYLDTTGEQDFVLATKRDYHEAFQKAGRVLYPACAWMWTAGLLAAEVCLETEGIDSLDIVYASKGRPTLASTKSFMRMNCRTHYYLENNALMAWPPASRRQVTVPGIHEIMDAVPWGGGCEPVWYHEDPRVRNCKVVVALGGAGFADSLVALMKEFQEKAKTLSDAELEEMTNAWGESMANPPEEEDFEVNRYTISCHARGMLKSTQCTLTGTSPYTQTGLLCAEAAQRILEGKAKQFGFVSGAQAFGARELLDALSDEALQDRAPRAWAVPPRKTGGADTGFEVAHVYTGR